MSQAAQVAEVGPTVRYTDTPEHFLLIARSVADLVDEARVTFTPRLMRIAVVDPAHVAMKVVEVKEHEHVATSGDLVFLLDLDRLKVLEALTQDAAASFTFERRPTYSGGDRLTVTQGDATIHLKMSDPSNVADPKVPHLGNRARFTTQAKHLQKAMQVGEQLSDHVAILMQEHPSRAGHTVEVRAGDSGDGDSAAVVRVPVTKSSVAPSSAPQEWPVRGLYSCDYVRNGLGKFSPDSDVEASFGTDYPIEFRGKVGFADLLFIMAPRIESASD